MSRNGNICLQIVICTSARLFVQGGKEITSSEGTTQGDSFATPMYAIGVTPLLNNIKMRQIPKLNMQHSQTI